MFSSKVPETEKHYYNKTDMKTDMCFVTGNSLAGEFKRDPSGWAADVVTVKCDVGSTLKTKDYSPADVTETLTPRNTRNVTRSNPNNKALKKLANNEKKYANNAKMFNVAANANMGSNVNANSGSNVNSNSNSNANSNSGKMPIEAMKVPSFISALAAYKKAPIKGGRKTKAKRSSSAKRSTKAKRSKKTKSKRSKKATRRR